MQVEIKSVLKQYFELSDEEAEEMIYDAMSDEMGAFDKKFADKLGLPMPSVSLDVNGLTLLDKELDVNIQCIFDNTGEYLALLSFGNMCADVDAANVAMNAYDKSSYSRLLPIESEVGCEQDFLTLAYTFYAQNVKEFQDGIDKLFATLFDDEFQSLLSNVLQYFEN